MKKVINIIFLLTICLFPRVVGAKDMLTLEYELRDLYFLYEDSGNYHYITNDFFYGDFLTFDAKGELLKEEDLVSDDMTNEEFLTTERYKKTIKFYNDAFNSFYDIENKLEYGISYVDGYIYYYDREQSRYVHIYFDDNLDLTRSILGEKYDVYKELKTDEMYIYGIEIFENTIVVYSANDDNNYATIYDKDLNIIRSYIYNYGGALFKEIDGVIYLFHGDDEIEATTYKLNGDEIRSFGIDSEYLHLDICGSYGLTDINALNNKLFVMFEYHQCPPNRIVMNDASDAFTNTQGESLPECFTQVYSLNYEVEKVQSSNGNFEFKENMDKDGNVVVELDIEPNQGYIVDKIIVMDINGNKIEVTDNKFLKPMNDVTVEVQFKQGEYLPIPDTGLGRNLTIVLISLILIGLGFYTINYVKREN